MWEFMKTNNGSRWLAAVAGVAAIGADLATPGKANADPARSTVPAQPLPNALKNFAALGQEQCCTIRVGQPCDGKRPVTGQLERHAAWSVVAMDGTGRRFTVSDNTATIRSI